MKLHTMLEKDMLLWKSFNSLENIFSVESETKSGTDEDDSFSLFLAACEVIRFCLN